MLKIHGIFLCFLSLCDDILNFTSTVTPYNWPYIGVPVFFVQKKVIVYMTKVLRNADIYTIGTCRWENPANCWPDRTCDK